MQDLHAYWPLLSDKGVLMGDDFLSHDGVTRAAHEFAREVRLPIVGHHGKFVISKKTRP